MSQSKTSDLKNLPFVTKQELQNCNALWKDSVEPTRSYSYLMLNISNACAWCYSNSDCKKFMAVMPRLISSIHAVRSCRRSHVDDTWDQNMILDGDVLVIFLDFPWVIWKCAWQQNMVLPSIVKFKCQAIVKFQCRDQLAQWGNAIGAGWGGPFKKCSNLLD